MKVVARDSYIEKLKHRMGNGMVKIITGLRRSGKSFLLFTLFCDYLKKSGVAEKDIVAINLEDPDCEDLRSPHNLFSYLKSRLTDDSNMRYVFIDEAQLCISKEETKKDEPLELYSILNALMRRHNVDVYITGSNSRFLSTDVRTDFRGCGDEVKLHPLTFAEYSSVVDGNFNEVWNKYCLYGGLPFVTSCDTDEQIEAYLSNVFNAVYVNDIAEHYGAKESRARQLMNILASSIGFLSNPRKLAASFRANGIDVTEPTISSYISYFEDSFLIEKCRRYDIKGKKYIDSPYKYYFTDMGLRNAMLNFRQVEPSHVMENVIYNELVARGYNVDVGTVYNQTFNGTHAKERWEVDFVCNFGYRRYYIQSAFRITDEEKFMREERSLLAIGDGFKKIMIVGDDVPKHYNADGVFIIGLRDFLMDATILDRD